MPVDWNSAEVCEWKQQCLKEQEEYLALLGSREWSRFKPWDYDNLKRNIGFAIYGPPEIEPDDNNEYLGYNKRQLKHIKEIFKLMRNESCIPNIYVSFIFVLGKVKDSRIKIPVIRLRTSIVNYVFIDSCPRVYRSWENYLKENKLPACLICYPRNGIYTKGFQNNTVIEFGVSPASSLKAKMKQGCDIAATVVSLSAAGFGIAGMFIPVAWPLIAVAGLSSGTYSMGRSIEALADRDRHKQSTSLNNAESRNCWLNIASNVVGITAVGSVARAARVVAAGELSVAGQIAIRAASTSACGITALGVVNGLLNIFEKDHKNDITTLDVVQFISSVLFFTHSTISVYQANTLIKSFGNNTSNEYCETVFSVMKRINEFSVENGISSDMVSQLTSFRSLSGFVLGSSILPMSKVIVEESFFYVFKSICNMIKHATTCFIKGITTFSTYVKDIGKLLKRAWQLWNEEITQALIILAEAFGAKHWSEVIIHGSRVLDGTKSCDIQEIANVLVYAKKAFEKELISEVRGRISTLSNELPVASTSRENVEVPEATCAYEVEIAKIHANFSKTENCKTAAEFLRLLKFVCNFVHNEFLKEKEIYTKALNLAKHYSPNLNENNFDAKYGIIGTRSDHFFQQAMKQFKDDKGLFCLKLAYQINHSISKQCDNFNTFEMDNITIINFNNIRGENSTGMLSKEQYHKIASNLMHLEAVDENNTSFIEDGSTVIMQVSGKAIIMVHTYKDNDKVSGIAFFVPII